MYVPRARERVFLSGKNQLYEVVSVDHQHKEADLIPVIRAALVQHNVPFSRIEPLDADDPLEFA